MHRDAPYYPIVFYFEQKPILFKRKNTEGARLAMGNRLLRGYA